VLFNKYTLLSYFALIFVLIFYFSFIIFSFACRITYRVHRYKICNENVIVENLILNFENITHFGTVISFILPFFVNNLTEVIF